MWKFIKKKWYDKSDTANPRIPMSAENLNRIEDGIQEALDGIDTAKNELVKYIDDNILYFTGAANVPSDVWTDIFQLPQGIDFSKYIVLFQGMKSSESSVTRVVPYDVIVRTFYSSTSNYREIKVSSTGLVSYYSSRSYSDDVHIILLPVNKRDMISLT